MSLSNNLPSRLTVMGKPNFLIFPYSCFKLEFCCSVVYSFLIFEWCRIKSSIFRKGSFDFAIFHSLFPFISQNSYRPPDLLLSGKFQKHRVVGGALHFPFSFSSFPTKRGHYFLRGELGGVVCGLLICNGDPLPSCLLCLCLQVPRAINVLSWGAL